MGLLGMALLLSILGIWLGGVFRANAPVGLGADVAMSRFQPLWMLAGLAGCIVAGLSVNRLRPIVAWLLVAGLVLLALPFVPGLAMARNEMHRWILLPGYGDFVGVGYWGALLLLPWLAERSSGGGNRQQAARDGVLFAGVIILANLLIWFQRFPGLALLLNATALVLMVTGGLGRPSKAGLALLSVGCIFLQALAALRWRQAAMANGEWSGQYLQPTGIVHNVDHELVQRAIGQMGHDAISEHAPRLLGLSLGIAVILFLSAVILIFVRLLWEIVRELPAGNQRQFVIAVSGFLVMPMLGSIAGALLPGRMLPSFAFPFLSAGFQITLTSWIAMGWVVGLPRLQPARTKFVHIA